MTTEIREIDLNSKDLGSMPTPIKLIIIKTIPIRKIFLLYFSNKTKRYVAVIKRKSIKRNIEIEEIKISIINEIKSKIKSAERNLCLKTKSFILSIEISILHHFLCAFNFAISISSISFLFLNEFSSAFFSSNVFSAFLNCSF